MNATEIFSNNNGTLSFGEAGATRATVKDYEVGDRCIGSIFEALVPGEKVQLCEGIFILDDDLDLMSC